ncbi:hypothetical protein [Nocardioides sp. CER19]|uniref:hypothetical protein n=1 Tax=Nocardioides sp. CER19 TaxID=3038538 RepID=UPI00244CC9F4|nr:hypothetical protein [Nocardioides sp. CER19]MDH2412648.1 hypothetical protein [Nocardioides sp. CER19]
MGPDPHEIRALAHRIRQQGAEVRADARALVARGHAVGWTGLAGAAMFDQTVAQAHVLTRIAARHETAARALDAHAAALEDALALVAEIERRVRTAVDGARSRLGRFLDGLIDAVGDDDETLARFTAPPPGSAEWLQVRLPGVALPGPLR